MQAETSYNEFFLAASSRIPLRGGNCLCPGKYLGMLLRAGGETLKARLSNAMNCLFSPHTEGKRKGMEECRVKRR